jgi:osmotically-inducible protein OsmY
MRSLDAALHRKVLTELESEPSLSEQEIGIAVHGGVVTLLGHVDSHDHRRAAEQAVARVIGVEAVADELDIRAPGPRERTDTEIAHAVASHLQSWNKAPEQNVKVKVERGYVTLEGEVELFHDKAAAEESISDLRGVRGVVNLITVKPPELVEDIKSKIEAALVQMAHRDAARISVEVRGSNVTLNGTVSSITEECEALGAARSVPCVTEVKDRLRIQSAEDV